MHPATLTVTPSSRRNRGTVLVRLILAIPHMIVVAVWGVGVQFAVLAHWFIQVFTGRRNRAIFDFVARWQQYAAQFYGYLWLGHDKFPAFGVDPASPVQTSVTYEPSVNRLTAGLRIIWAMPAMLFLSVLNAAMEIVGLISWFAIVFTGRQPDGLFSFTERYLKVWNRTTAYLLLQTDAYPPFEF